jgi:hypothetical protein
MLIAALLVFTCSHAHPLLMHAVGEHTVPNVTPAAYHLTYKDVLITSSDEIHLLGWYIASRNGAVIRAQHGYKSNREAFSTKPQCWPVMGIVAPP